MCDDLVGFFSDILSTDLYSLGAMAMLHKDLIKEPLNMMNPPHLWSVNRNFRDKSIACNNNRIEYSFINSRRGIICVAKFQ